MDSEILEKALREIHADQVKHHANCVVCGGDCAPNSTEGLCWVCRRLKISAWRDAETSEGQSAQE